MSYWGIIMHTQLNHSILTEVIVSSKNGSRRKRERESNIKIRKLVIFFYISLTLNELLHWFSSSIFAVRLHVMYLNRFQEDIHLRFCYDLVSPYLSIKNLSGSLFVVSLLLGWHYHWCIPMIKGFQACWQSSNFWLLVVYMGMGIFYHDFRLIQYSLVLSSH